MIHVLILCKEKNHVSILSESICKCVDESLCMISTNDIDEAARLIDKQQTIFDLFILSVKLGNRSGYTVEKLIRQHRIYSQTPILFITALSYNLIGFSELATFHAYQKYNFISLPLNKIDIQSKVNLYLDSIAAQQRQNEYRSHYMDLKNPGRIKKVPIKNILFLEIQNKTCRIYTYKEQYEIKRTSLSKVLANIDGNTIIRCHRFFAVNVKNIDFVERYNSRILHIHFVESNQICPASKGYYKNIPLCQIKTPRS